MMSDDFDAEIGAALEAEINAKAKKPDTGRPAEDAVPESRTRPDAQADADAPMEAEADTDVEVDAAEATPSAPVEQPEPAQPTPSDAGAAAERVRYEKRGNLGLITLDRPEALNALELEMVRAIEAAVTEADADDEVLSIAIQSPHRRAFCAGGDIRQLWEWGRGGKRELFVFYREEYRLNRHLARLRTPYVSLMDGIVMGGGAGLALYAQHRVVSETVSFAMPEVGIGFVPDVGITHLLARMPGRSGRYLALTGERVGSADMLWGGLADALVPQEHHDNLLDRLAEGESADESVEAFASDAPQAPLAGMAETIDDVFAGDVMEVLEALDARDGDHADWARATAATIRKQCPFSVLAAQGLLDRAEGASLEDCLVNEFRAATRAVQRQDFYEGVRAAVVDKDRKPRWRPSTLADIDPAEIEALFEPSPMRDVSFPEI